jgi:hypothetical protein
VLTPATTNFGAPTAGVGKAPFITVGYMSHFEANLS